MWSHGQQHMGSCRGRSSNSSSSSSSSSSSGGSGSQIASLFGVRMHDGDAFVMEPRKRANSRRGTRDHAGTTPGLRRERVNVSCIATPCVKSNVINDVDSMGRNRFRRSCFEWRHQWQLQQQEGSSSSRSRGTTAARAAETAARVAAAGAAAGGSISIREQQHEAASGSSSRGQQHQHERSSSISSRDATAPSATKIFSCGGMQCNIVLHPFALINKQE